MLRGLAASAGLTLVHPQLAAGSRSGPATGAGASARVSGKIVARQVDHPSPALLIGLVRRSTGELVATADAGATGAGTISVTSPVIDAEQLFERVGVHYQAARGAEDGIFVEIRTSSGGIDWTDWQALHRDDNLTDTWTNTYYIEPAAVPQTSRLAQYRVWLTGGDPEDLRHLALTFLDVSDLNAGPVARLLTGFRGALGDLARGLGTENVAMAAPTGASPVLAREDWGADEGLLRWTPRYETWKKAVIHHTVTSDGGTDVAAEMRAIYYFHAVTRGWGDIGYHYLVDKYGNIWEGRQGGDHVIGGHAYGWNDGTFGVAAIGDYSNVAPTSAMQGAIANIIALKLKQLGVAPYGSGSFTHEEQRSDGSWVDVTTTAPNILGHRDCTYTVGASGGQTACPGGKTYAMMDGLRRLAQSAWDAGYTVLTKIDPQMAHAGYPGQKLNVTVLVTNRGTQAIPAGTKVNYRVISRGSVSATGAGVQLTKPIASGATGSVVVPFTAPPQGEHVVSWGLQAGSAWWSTVYNDQVREIWFRSKDWSADWEDSNVPSKWTAGETRAITVTVRNDGGRTWPATGTNPVKVGYYWLSTSTGNRFDAPSRIALPRDVAPGQSVTLTLSITAPVYPTNYTLVLDLRKENEFWFRDKGLAPDDTQVTVGTDFKARYTLPATLPPFESGKIATVPVVVANTGLGTFPVTNSYPVTLGYHWYDARGGTAVWDGRRTKLPADLLKGKTVTIDAQVQAPPKGGDHRLRFDLVQEGVGWFSEHGVPMSNSLVAVAGPVIPVYAVAYEPGVTTLARSGSLTALPFTLRNNSNFTWSPTGANPVTLSYHWIAADGHVVQWEGLRTKLPGAVEPGQSVTVQAQVAIPAEEGTYTLRWDLVHEGIAWFSAKGASPFDQAVVVGPPPTYGGSLDVSAVPASATAGGTFSAPLRIQNMSDFTWDPLINLSYHWYDATGRNVVWEGMRTPLTGIAPNEVRAVTASVLAPAVAGTYTLRFDIVHEGVTWFSFSGMQLPSVSVTVKPAGFAAQYFAPGEASGKVGGSITVPVLLQNNGDIPLEPGKVNLAYHLYAESGNVYVWDGARTALPTTLRKGERAVLSATVRVPERAGTFTLRFDLVEEGVAWFSSRGVAMSSTTLTVN